MDSTWFATSRASSAPCARTACVSGSSTVASACSSSATATPFTCSSATAAASSMPETRSSTPWSEKPYATHFRAIASTRSTTPDAPAICATTPHRGWRLAPPLATIPSTCSSSPVDAVVGPRPRAHCPAGASPLTSRAWPSSSGPTSPQGRTDLLRPRPRPDRARRRAVPSTPRADPGRDGSRVCIVHRMTRRPLDLDDRGPAGTAGDQPPGRSGHEGKMMLRPMIGERRDRGTRYLS